MTTKNLYGIGLNIGKGQNGYLTILADNRLVQDDLKQIVFTSPGERVFNPSFGVGIDRYLFEQNTYYTAKQIETAIRSQVATYLPVVNIQRIDFQSTNSVLEIKIVYNILDTFGTTQELTIKRSL